MRRERARAESTHPPDLPPAQGESAPWIIRTALCTEVRGGVLRVFMPPQRYLEDYLELVAAVEDTAANLDIPVLVEGYTPPHDPRINAIKVTPDPGVIEVNTQPGGVVGRTGEEHHGALRRGAPEPPGHRKIHARRPAHRHRRRQSHRGRRRRRPADSPLLRNPGLLRSLVGYWHNHPALSYLFSGLFVGPTSQAPRVDEARNDQVYELEIAFQASSRRQASRRRGWSIASSATSWSTPPAIRIARNSASTSSIRRNRASGRLGLLEMRAFEMPPHARMSLTQHLLLRVADRASSGSSRTAKVWSAGGRRFTTASCCRISCSRIWKTSSPI